MKLRHRAALDGIQLDEIDEQIMITKIDEQEGKEQFSTVSLWGGEGSRVTNMHRDSLDVAVRFVIRLRKREMAAREEALEKANAWAMNGGWLTLNYKENRRIKVFRAAAAAMGDPWDWTREFAIVFRACGVPYWQEEDGAIVEKQNTSGGTLTLGVAGSAKSALDASFKNTSGGTIDSFSINTGESAMTLSGLGLRNGETLKISHNDNGKRCLLAITAGGRSALACRTAGSSDDLTISPGVKTIRYSAGGAGKITVGCNGRFA